MHYNVNFAELQQKDQAAGYNVHDHLKHLSVPELQELTANDRLPFDIALMNITGDLNVGSILRAALMTGAENAYLFGRQKHDRRSEVGCSNYINIHYIPYSMDENLNMNVDVFKDFMKDRIPVMVEQGGTNLHEFNWNDVIVPNKRICLVFGNEGRGIPNNIIDAGKALDGKIVSIKQRGPLRSFNVNSAASITMFEMCRALNWL